MTNQRIRLNEHGFIGWFWIPLLLLGFVLAGCDQIQQLLAPLPSEDGETVKIGFIYTTPNRINSRYGAELATNELNEEGGVRGTPIELIAHGIPTQRLVSARTSAIPSTSRE